MVAGLRISTHLSTGIALVHLQAFLCFADATSLGVVNGRHVGSHICRTRCRWLLRTGGADVGGRRLLLDIARAMTRASLPGFLGVVICWRQLAMVDVKRCWWGSGAALEML